MRKEPFKPVFFSAFSAPTHWIELMSCCQASAALGDELIIGFRCVGAGEHPKPAAQSLLETVAFKVVWEFFWGGITVG